MEHLFEVDGSLIDSGRRLIQLSLIELLNYSTYLIYKGLDGEGRQRVDLAMEGRLGANGGEIIDDPALPESMQGLEAPTWWNGKDDPWADSHDLSGTDLARPG